MALLASLIIIGLMKTPKKILFYDHRHEIKDRHVPFNYVMTRKVLRILTLGIFIIFIKIIRIFFVFIESVTQKWFRVSLAVDPTQVNI